MRRKKILVIALLAFSTLSTFGQKVTLNYRNQSLKTVFAAVTQQTGYSFMYSPQVVNLNTRVNISANRQELSAVMNRLLNGINIGYTIRGKEIVLFKRDNAANASSQRRVPTGFQSFSVNDGNVVSGVVRDVKGDPIIGANVLITGTNHGVVTDASGRFTLDNVSNNALLQISYVGYQTQTIPVRNKSKFNIILQEKGNGLNELVVVGYGVQKKVDLTGAVSTVDVSKSLVSRPVTDVSKALQGEVPGLNVQNVQGGINEEPSLTIRGIGTLSNGSVSKPLVVVDGVPMEDISYLNTQDIAKISVLKDAASTSIYGTRAAFGVILITTKTGTKTDKITINYSNNFAWDTPTVLPDYPDVPSQLKAMIAASDRSGVQSQLFGMNLKEVLPLSEEWEKRHSWKKAGYRDMVKGDDYIIKDNGSVLYLADWDVVGIMFRDWTPSQSHSVNVQGTSGRTSYYLSAGYSDKEGVLNFNPDKLKKYNAMLNVTSDVTTWLQVGGRFSYNEKVYNQPNSQRDTYQYLWRWGSFFGPYGTIDGVDLRNDIAYLKQAGEDKTTSSYVRVGSFIKLKPFKGFTINGDITFNIENVDRKQVGLPVYGYDSWGGKLTQLTYIVQQSSSYLYQQHDKNTSYALNIYASYNIDIDRIHHIGLMMGGNAEEGNYNWFSAQRMGLLSNSKPEFPLTNGDQTTNGGDSHWGACGYFGRINYSYNDIWLLELNGRYDGSSKFPSNSHWAFFPSASFGYRFSQEKYFDKLRTVITNGKIRYSIGSVGNQAIGDNMFISTIATNVATGWLDDSGNKLVSFNMPTLVSPQLTWEKIKTSDIGIDLSFLRGDLNITFDWYQRNTDDMLAPGKVLPSVLGDASPYTNAGSLRTRGWELNVDWQHSFKSFLVYASFNVSNYATKITKWSDDSRMINSYYSGKTYGDIWGLETDRFFTKDDFTYNAKGEITGYAKGIASQKGLEQGSFTYGPGDVKFKDLNGDGIIDGGKGTAEDHGDLKIIGNSMPKYQYSFRIGGEWKGLDIDMFFQGIGKHDIWSLSAFVMPMMRGVDALYANQTDYWTENNIDAKYPRLYPSNNGYGTIPGLDAGNHNFYPQSGYLVHASYLRFKTLTLGYTLPEKLLHNIFVKKVRFYFSANNLCELINNSDAPVDPEINAGSGSLRNGVWGRIAPFTRTLSFGAQLTF